MRYEQQNKIKRATDEFVAKKSFDEVVNNFDYILHSNKIEPAKKQYRIRKVELVNGTIYFELQVMNQRYNSYGYSTTEWSTIQTFYMLEHAKKRKSELEGSQIEKIELIY